LERELLNFFESCNKSSFMQTPLWAKVKSEWKNKEIILRDENGKIIAYLLVLIRKVPYLDYKIMYSPRGPVCNIENAQILTKLTDEIKKIAKKEKAYIFRIDPDVPKENVKFINQMIKLGYNLKTSKNFEGIQPNFVFRLNIENKDEDEIFNSFHQKWRYNIRLASRKGVEVLIGSRNDLPRFTEIMKETGARDNFITRNLKYFEKMYDELGENLRLYIARLNGEIIAGTIAIHFCDKVWYLYGASSNKSRNVMPNYLLQWEMIKWAIAEKCRIYDFRGVSGDLSPENPLYGLYRFKKGFNGDFTEFVGEFQLVFKPFVNSALNFADKFRKKAMRYIKR